MMTDTKDALREAGLRVTAPRLATMVAVSRAPHSDAAAVFAAVSRELPDTSIQAVYNVLNDLTRAGLLRRIEPAGSAARYELHGNDNHHHLICRSCGRIEDIACAVGQAPCLSPEQTHGFDIDEAEVTFWGLCSSCTKHINGKD